jgi:hypothetical protein
MAIVGRPRRLASSRMCFCSRFAVRSATTRTLPLSFEAQRHNRHPLLNSRRPQGGGYSSRIRTGDAGILSSTMRRPPS